MPEIESAVIRVVAEVSSQLAPRLADKLEFRRASVPTAATDALLNDLGRDTAALLAYLESPDFAAVVAQHRVGNLGGKAAKDQLYQGLRLAGVADDHLARTTEVVYGVMAAACAEAAPQFNIASSKIDRSDLYTAATSNSLMLKRLRSATRIHAFAARMRDQVSALHSKIRLPHVGISRSVRYDELYVEPTLAPPAPRLGAPGVRVVVLGDPGAGKSTLAAKFAHDIAVDGAGRVPFLLVLREFATSFDEGGRDLLHYLEKLCQAPYNVKPPRDGVEYLLRTGRAVVILDGLDELVQTELRRRVVSLVEGFAHLYPLVPILVTARKIGYEDAPLSTDLFVPSHIVEFSKAQVGKYVARWFKLDEATSQVEREQLVQSFMEDSEQIPELRSNPLLLTMLCAMYSSDRYLPRNLAQVYERCALMLFEQWDSKRGIALPLKFHGRLRGAVQHLAWTMFNARESSKSQSRTRIINTLARYLDPQLDDHDESVATAEEFLAHCTGRAWILTDVGATASEPQFGFTHRTFLEYFAAEHLVRTRRTATELWKVLRPTDNRWYVVAQIVLQLYDRNVEGGVDELLTEALDNEGLAFAARSLHYVHPSKRTVRAIATAAVDRSVHVPLQYRTEVDQHNFKLVDEPLRSCMFTSSAANIEGVVQAVTERLGQHIQNGEIGAAVVLDHMVRYHSGEVFLLWLKVRQELNSTHSAQLVELRESTPWGGRLVPRQLDSLLKVVRRFGVSALYAQCAYYDSRRYSAAQGLLVTNKQIAPLDMQDTLAVLMTTQPTPWTSHGYLSYINPQSEYDEGFDGLRMMLSLPLLELSRHDERRLPTWWLEQEDVPPQVREFLHGWERGEFSVLSQAQ